MLKDPRRLIFIFGAPLAYLLLFKMLYAPNLVKEIPLVIYDAENTKLSREIVTGFSDSDSFKVVAQAASEEEMLRFIRDKRAFVALEIPADFSRQTNSTVLCTINGANIILTNVASAAAQEILNSISDKVAAQRASLRLGLNEKFAAKKIQPVITTLRVLGNPTQGYLLFFPIGLALAAFQQGLIFTIGAAIINERQLKFWRLIFGKTIFYWAMMARTFSR